MKTKSKKPFSVNVKLNKALIKVESVMFNVFGYKDFILANPYTIEFKAEGSEELVFRHKKWQNGMVEVKPIHCVRDYGVSPKEFVKQFDKQNKKLMNLFEKKRLAEIKKIGYKPYMGGIGWEKINKKSNLKK